MSQSSPEGIILGKGSKLVSAELSINKEKVLDIKKENTRRVFTQENGWQDERIYTEEEVIGLLKAYKIATGSNEDALCFFEKFKKINRFIIY